MHLDTVVHELYKRLSLHHGLTFFCYMQVLLRIRECFGSNYLTLVMLPIFRSANGDDFDDANMSFRFSNRVKGTFSKVHDLMLRSVDLYLSMLGFSTIIPLAIGD